MELFDEETYRFFPGSEMKAVLLEKWCADAGRRPEQADTPKHLAHSWSVFSALSLTTLTKANRRDCLQ